MKLETKFLVHLASPILTCAYALKQVLSIHASFVQFSACSEYSKESFRVVVYCSIIKVLCVVAILATAHLYYHKPYFFVNNFFHFFIFHVVLIAHNQGAGLTTNVIISRHSGIVNNVFAFYLFQTIRTICIEVQPGASNRQNNRELAHIVVLSVRSIWRSAAARIRCRTADSSCMAELHTSEL